jgi:hypothetical protein
MNFVQQSSVAYVTIMMDVYVQKTATNAMIDYVRYALTSMKVLWIPMRFVRNVLQMQVERLVYVMQRSTGIDIT